MFTGFNNDLGTLTGFQLELLTVSLFQTLGYYVDSNLTWMEERESGNGSSGILEIDVLAKAYSPLKITKVLTECKRGCDFNDFFKYLGICHFLKVDSKYLICQSNHFEELYKLGLKNNMIVIEPDNILSAFSVDASFRLNIFRGINTISLSIVDKQIIANLLHPGTRLTRDEQDAYSLIRKYLINLNGWIWKETDPRVQYKMLSQLLNENSGFVNKIGRILGLGRSISENLMRDNALCNAAGYTVLQAKITYIVCAVECAINSLTSPDDNYLSTIDDPIFIECIQKMRDSILIACKIPVFVQVWINVFGGMINMNGHEIEKFALFINERENVVIELLSMLEEIFTLLSGNANIQWGFIEDFGIKMFRYVPRAIRGVGIAFRKHNNIDVEEFCFGEEWEAEMLSRLESLGLSKGE